MPRTSEDLITCCLRDEMPELPVIADYFGNARTDYEMSIVFSVYRGLVIYSDVDADLLHNCLLSNRLNELVHAKYKYKKTVAYNFFCNNNIDLTDRFCLGTIDPSEYLPIRDDHCPNCDTVGYYTEDLRCDSDCAKCLKLMCEKCVADTELCIKCS